MKIICISDTHRKEFLVDLPDGDILIHAGDFDIYNGWHFDKLCYWLNEMSKKYKHVIWIAGNHDFYFQGKFNEEIQIQLPYNVHYLMNSSVTIEGIKIWGSPFSPVFNEWAFMGYVFELKKIWNTIPEDTDIVITHCPPFGINDQVYGFSQGCPALREKIKEIKPKYHVHGHIHEGYGIYQDENTTYINASILDGFYDLTNERIVIDYED